MQNFDIGSSVETIKEHKKNFVIPISVIVGEYHFLKKIMYVRKKWQMKDCTMKNRPQMGSGPSYSDSPSDNVNSSIASSPTDTARTSKNPPAKIIKNITAVLAKIQKFENDDFNINYSKGWKRALIDIRKLLNLRYIGGSNYADYILPNHILSLRLSDHNANGNNFPEKNTNISIYVALNEYKHIPTKVPYREFKVDSETYNENPQEVISQIILAVKYALNGYTFHLDNNIATEVKYDANDML